MKLTIKHYYSFGHNARKLAGNLISKEGWDAVRLDENADTPFSIPSNRQAWMQKCEGRKDMASRAKAIGELVKKHGFKKVVSLGAGAGLMEYHLHKQVPDLELECSDFSPQSVERLRKIFPEAKVVRFDMLHDKWTADLKALYVLHRIDTDFSNHQWKTVFAAMASADIKNILFAPCDVTGVIAMTRMEISMQYQRWVKKNALAFAGYLRNRESFLDLFSARYALVQEFPVADLTGFYLVKK